MRSSASVPALLGRALLAAALLGRALGGCAPAPAVPFAPSDAGRDIGEGASCASAADCAAGLECAPQVTASGVTLRCSACPSGAATCGADGRCVAVTTASGVVQTCSFGRSGEPCAANTDCVSSDCQTTVTAGGTTSSCR